MDFSSNCASILLLLTIAWGFQYSCCQAFGRFGFDLHHRYSDTVKRVLGQDGLPEKGTVDYYAAMVHHDRFRRGRHLAAFAAPPPLTFSGGGVTSEMFTLHYANVTMGSPGVSFFVALDTGSDLFWLPCDCFSCYVNNAPGARHYNIYNRLTSSTSETVSCGSPYCVGLPDYRCNQEANACFYYYAYESNDTSTFGYMLEDLLHLTEEDNQNPALAQVPFGCGTNQTGIFLNGYAAPNGLLGLGMGDFSVPSVLARIGDTVNSFSMCFAPDGFGRISFGDTVSSGQAQTPFNLNTGYTFYNVTVSQVTVGNKVTHASFTAIFDSGTSFTSLSDPAYTIISESFNSQSQQAHYFNFTPYFEYCYYQSFQPPTLSLTMNGGDKFYVTQPLVNVVENGVNLYCLAIVRTSDLNIIGQNFMTGYNFLFDRDNMVLGWEACNCAESSGAESSKSSAGSLISSPFPHNIQEAFAGFLFIFLLYSALI